MAVGEAPLPEFFPIKGVRLGIASAGVKTLGKKDILLIELSGDASCSGVFTTNAFCAAPVIVCKKHLQNNNTRYLLVNTGNANAGTGEQGMQAAMDCVHALAEKTGSKPEAILPFSTGVIGEPLPKDKIIDALDDALADLSEDHWPEAASAILTTDTRPKGVSHRIEINGQWVHFSGISKGAGMIRPNMATMLAYVATDAKISRELLNPMLKEASKLSFNRISIDGDMSTNDSAMLMATGTSGVDADKLSRDELELLQEALNLVFVELAQLIVRDGEGATKFIHIHVKGGKSEKECEQVAYAVANSPLFKTAMFASDPNWGRILAAIGYSGIENLDVDKVTLHINEVLIAEKGQRAASYSEEQGLQAIAPEELFVDINLGRGDASAIVWTSDLSYDYVRINAEYRT